MRQAILLILLGFGLSLPASTSAFASHYHIYERSPRAVRKLASIQKHKPASRLASKELSKPFSKVPAWHRDVHALILRLDQRRTGENKGLAVRTFTPDGPAHQVNLQYDAQAWPK